LAPHLAAIGERDVDLSLAVFGMNEAAILMIPLVYVALNLPDPSQPI
jgi:hypothetical protein